MNAKLVNDNGIIKISVNGETLDAVGYMTYNPDGGQFPKFTAIGNKIVFFGAYATDQGLNTLAGSRQFSPHFYIAEDTFDFTEVDRILEMIAPGGVGPYIIPRVYFSAPSWWERENPGECARIQTGESVRECYASDKWRQDMWKAVKALIDHINSSVWAQLVIGYHVAAGSTEEWGPHGHRITGDYFDYSEPGRRKFGQWLAEKYGSIDALNAAWAGNYGSFDEIRIPTPAQQRFSMNGSLRAVPQEQNVVDHGAFCSWLLADTIAWFCRQIKVYTNNSVLTGSFYAYILYVTDSTGGNFGLSQLLKSPDIDYICTTGFHCPVESVQLAGKLFITEADIRTCLTQAPGVTMPQIMPNNSYYIGGAWGGPDRANSVADMRKRSMEVLARHTGIWWFDMWGGWYEDPAFMEIIVQHAKLQAEQTVAPILPQIALIADEDGINQFAFHAPALKNALYGTVNQLRKCGAPHAVYTAKDLCMPEFPVEQFKLYIIAGGCHISDDVAKAINEKLKGGGRTILWTHFSGWDDETLTGFRLEYDKDSAAVQTVCDKGMFPSYKCAFKFRKETEAPVWPEKPVSCPRFADIDGAYIVAKTAETGEPALLWKQYADYSSVYSIVPGLPHQVLRELALLSGVHIFSQTGDQFFAGGKFVGLYAEFAGEKRIQFSFPVEAVYDAITGEKMDLNELFTDFTMEEHEARLFRFEC